MPNISLISPRKHGPSVAIFSLSNQAVIALKTLKANLCNASQGAVQDGISFEVETNASDFALAAELLQDGRPVVFSEPFQMVGELSRRREG